MGTNSDFESLQRLDVAAIHHDGTTDVDRALADFAGRQRLAGRQVLGLLMSHRDDEAGCRAAMVLTDIDTGEEYLVSQSLGSGSSACRADPQGFARASRVLHDALERRPDLVISNRFGSLEAASGGFAAELLALLAERVPVLTVVATRHLDAWREFVGEASLLPSDPVAWAAWFDAVLARRHPGAAVGVHVEAP
jgi:nucleoside-triphosphatase THEP1